MASKRLVAEQATVYWGGGRRWLSPKAAARAEANKAIRRHCECEDATWEYPGYACRLHSSDRHIRIRDALTKRYMRAFRRGHGQ